MASSLAVAVRVSPLISRVTLSPSCFQVRSPVLPLTVAVPLPPFLRSRLNPPMSSPPRMTPIISPAATFHLPSRASLEEGPQPPRARAESNRSSPSAADRYFFMVLPSHSSDSRAVTFPWHRPTIIIAGSRAPRPVRRDQF